MEIFHLLETLEINKDPALDSLKMVNRVVASDSLEAMDNNKVTADLDSHKMVNKDLVSQDNKAKMDNRAVDSGSQMDNLDLVASQMEVNNQASLEAMANKVVDLDSLDKVKMDLVNKEVYSQMDNNLVSQEARVNKDPVLDFQARMDNKDPVLEDFHHLQLALELLEMDNNNLELPPHPQDFPNSQDLDFQAVMVEQPSLDNNNNQVSHSMDNNDQVLN